MSLIQSDIRVEQENIYPKYVKDWADTLVQEIQNLRRTLQIPLELDERTEKAYLFSARFIYDLANAASLEAFHRIRDSLIVRLQESDLTAYPKLVETMIGRLQIFAEAVEDLYADSPHELNEFRLALEQEPKNLTILGLIARFDGIQRFNSEKLIKALVLLGTTTPEEARYYNTALRKLRVKKYLQEYVVTEPERLVTILDVACFPEEVVDSIRLYSNSPGFNETINIFARIVGNNHYILDKVDTLATVVTNQGYGIDDIAIILSSLESIDNLFGIKGLNHEDYSRITKLVIQSLQSRGVNGTGRLSNLLALHNALKTPEVSIKEISASFTYQYRMYDTYDQANNFRDTVVEMLKKKLEKRRITKKAYERIIADMDSIVTRHTLQVAAFPEQSRASIIESENPEQLAVEKKLTFAEKVRIKVRDSSFQDAYLSERLDLSSLDDEVIKEVSAYIFNDIESISKEQLESESASLNSIQVMLIKIYRDALTHFASRIEQKYFDAVFRVILEIVEDGDRFFTGFNRNHARIISFDLDNYNKERIFKNKLTQESLDLFIVETISEGRTYGRVDISSINLKYLESLGFGGDKLYRIYLNVITGNIESVAYDLFSVFDTNGKSNHLYTMNKEYYSYLLLILVNWISKISTNPKETAKKLNVLVSLLVAQYDMKTNGDTSWGEVL